jgi:hypothetical protein
MGWCPQPEIWCLPNFTYFSYKNKKVCRTEPTCFCSCLLKFTIQMFMPLYWKWKTAVQKHMLWTLQTPHSSSTAYTSNSKGTTLQFNSIPYELCCYHTATQQHTLQTLPKPHCSSTAYLMRPTDTTLQFKSILLSTLLMPHCSSTAYLRSSADTTLKFNNIPYEH